MDSTELPNIVIHEANGDTVVFWDTEELLHLRDNRHIRFRATPQNDHWVGTKFHPSDLAWAYQDFAGLEAHSISHRAKEDGFNLKLGGKKPGTDVEVEVTIEAAWEPSSRSFTYIQSSRLAGPLEEWYENSRWGEGRSRRDPASRSPVEASDYHLARISRLDRIFNRTTASDLYAGVAYSPNGQSWKLIPKLPIAFPANREPFIYDFRLPVGGKIGYLGRDEGGWIVEILDMSVPEMRVELCWSWYDIHNVLEEAIPPRHSSERFEAHYTWRFTWMPPEEAAAVLDAANEVPWRELENYDSPPVSWENRFDRPFRTDIWEFPWWRSSSAARWDKTSGYDDEYSLQIESDGSRPVAWYTFNWVYPFVWEPFINGDEAVTEERLTQLPPPFDLGPFSGRTYRLSAMVRTEEVAGEASIAMAKWAGKPIWLYSDVRSRAEAQAQADQMEWNRSRALSGSNDWTELSVEFTMDMFNRYIVLELNGSGRTWFDNVTIEEVLPGSRKKSRESEDVGPLAGDDQH